jgi:hypothetical protein
MYVLAIPLKTTMQKFHVLPSDVSIKEYNKFAFSEWISYGDFKFC